MLSIFNFHPLSDHYIQNIVCNNLVIYLHILQFDVKPEEADKVSPNRQTKPETVPAQKPKPQLVHPIDPPADIPGTSA